MPFLISVFLMLVVALAALHFCLRHWANISLLRLGDAFRLLTGMGAKLACSARHISGFDETRIRRDLTTYSPAYPLLSLRFADKRVTATLAGLHTRTAAFFDETGSLLDASPHTPETPAIPRATIPHTLAWPQGERAPAINTKIQELTDSLLRQDNRQGFDTRALLVVKDGQLIAESYGPGINNRTRLLGWSMSKSLTAILFGRMEQLGIACAGQNNLFDEWREDERCGITLEHLLQMRSGLSFDESYTPGSDVTRMLFSDHNCWRRALDSRLIHPPGRFFTYASGTTNLLTRWMQLRLGGGLACRNFLNEEILQPLGMHRTLFEEDGSGVLVGSSYTYASGRDWARLAQLMLDRGCANGRRILSQEWVTRASTPNASDNDGRYGYQFWLNRAPGMARRYPGLPGDASFMLGNHEQKVMIVPSQNTAVVRLGWCAKEYPVEARFQTLL